MSSIPGALSCCLGCLWLLAILGFLYGLLGMFYNWRLKTRRRWPLQRTAAIAGAIVTALYIVLVILGASA